MDSKITFQFQIKYETNQGENIYILGSDPIFGNWKDAKFRLGWYEGHIWKKDLTLPKSSNLIKYKFVCIGENNERRWEVGPNRLLGTEYLKGLKKTSDGKYILDCMWNHFKINFNIYFPLKNKYENMQIVGEPIGLANWLREDEKPIKMELSNDKEIVAKDGNAIRGKFWNVTIPMRIDDPRNYDFEYRYSIYNSEKKTAVWEREPNRHLKIIFDLDCEENKDLIDDNPDENKLLVNSFLEELDVNFVANLVFNRMGDKNIYIGPYPQSYNDFKEIAQANINSILNVQTDKDLIHRQINHREQVKECKELGIEITRFPIEDFNQEDLELKLKDAGDKLKELLDKGKTVYVHCTAGMSRAAATVIIYLVLYEDYSVEEARDFVKKHRPIICPNWDVINHVVAQYKPDKVDMTSVTAQSINLSNGFEDKIDSGDYSQSIMLNK